MQEAMKSAAADADAALNDLLSKNELKISQMTRELEMAEDTRNKAALAMQNLERSTKITVVHQNQLVGDLLEEVRLQFFFLSS